MRVKKCLMSGHSGTVFIIRLHRMHYQSLQCLSVCPSVTRLKSATHAVCVGVIWYSLCQIILASYHGNNQFPILDSSSSIYMIHSYRLCDYVTKAAEQTELLLHCTLNNKMQIRLKQTHTEYS